MTGVALEQEPRPLLVGERINSQGSRKMKRLLLADDYDGIGLVAREQVEGGAHVLDICVALTERVDEDVQMREVVRKLAQSIEAPLMIDSTEPHVIEVALQNYPGRAIVNSIHLEAGRAKIDVVMPLAEEHGAAVVALTIDEVGMAKTAAAQARGRATHPRHRRRRVRHAAGRADLRRADLHARDRRRRVRSIRPSRRSKASG